MRRIGTWRARGVLVVGVLWALGLAGCSRVFSRPSGEGFEPGRAHLAPGPLFAPRTSFRFALFLPSKAGVPLPPALPEYVRQRFPPLQLVNVASEGVALPTVRISESPASEYPLPDGETLEMGVRRLTPHEQAQLAAAERVLLLEFTTEPPALEAVRQAHALALELARAHGGLVWDEVVREFFSVEAWQALRLDGWEQGEPLLENHFNSYLFSEGEGIARILTVGMGKFGLPDLEVSQVPSALTSKVGTLLNLIAQLMLEGTPVQANGGFLVALDSLRFEPLRERLLSQVLSGAPRKTLVELSPVEPLEGSQDNRIVSLFFASHPGDTPSERPYAALAALFGAKDEIRSTDHDDELLAASRRARDELLFRIKPLFQEGMEPGTRLFVKAPFGTRAGGTEWMWILVTDWEASALAGMLDSEPEDVPGLKAGAPVEVNEDVLFDFLLVRPDGTTEGNQTERIILERSGGR
ncbi:DUF2314 domain-containing protein [Stigmatella aurantiaca]|uniref:Conserved uncharacterized protein n=1 Tax=Stigmatella aurantiaca (strain DW4/3-1) TaxID=378806 RepID=Q094Z4_STIAD|nr:DUF2314 domain-containing protein [Stigmatella aurantiaca]ADO71328.1 conserved uncharacterized protein [Stigmatella aurantiaca DW4/3-1]EAU67300.1 hypothetical protein STIAU_4931 [Stigmatella aurantiaca DW4/3-1]